MIYEIIKTIITSDPKDLLRLYQGVCFVLKLFLDLCYEDFIMFLSLS